MLGQVESGAVVECTDYPLGTVEGVKTDASGQPSALLVRHGRADYVLRVPVSLVDRATPGRVHLKIRLDEAETAAVAPEVALNGVVREGADTETTPFSDEVLGKPPGFLRTDPQT